MNDIQLYINDQLVDLSDDSPIAFTFQINNLAEVQNQQGNTSNQFKLPLTQRNRRILGFPDDVAFCTNLPYTKYDARLIQDGLEIVPYGIGELSGIDQDAANITILSGNVDFFDAIDGKLYDMGDTTSQWSNYGQSLVWQPYDHDWTLDNVVKSQVKTDGWIYPVVDYGNLSDDFTHPINVNYLRPGFFIKTAIDLLVKSAGYKATGSLLTNELYPLLIAQFSNGSWQHGTDYQNQPDLHGASVEKTGVTTLMHPNGFIIWNKINSDPSGQMVADKAVFTSAQRNDVKVVVSIPTLHLRGRVSPSDKSTHVTFYICYRDPNYPATPDIQLTSYDFSFNGFGENRPGDPDSDPKGWTRISGSGSNIYAEVNINDAVISFDTQLPEHGGLYVSYSWFGLDTPGTPAYGTLGQGITMSVTSQQQNVQFGQPVQCERIFPDIAQKDLLKDTLQRFGIVCQANNAAKTISFNSFHDIVSNIPIAKNWTSKCLDQGKTISFQLGGYAQVNTLKYQTDDAVLPAGFADGVIKVNDATLPATADLFESQFAPTLNRPYLDDTIAQIKMIGSDNDSTDFSIGVSPRILIDQKIDLRKKTKAITFTDGNGHNMVVNDYISTPYFYKPGGKYSLCFGDMKDPTTNQTIPGLKTKYYPELEKILKQTKKVVRYFLLTPRDILELDLLIPVYLEQDSAYYYINKIDSWRKGQPVKVELVKLG